MNTTQSCGGFTSAHDARDVQVTTFLRPNGMPEFDRPLCSGCRVRLAEMGYELRPGRAVPERTAWQRMRRVA